MKKYLLCLILSVILLAGISSSAVAANAAPGAEQLLKSIPTDLQKSAKAGADLTEKDDLKISGFTIEWGENDGAKYILKLSTQESGTASGQSNVKYGVFDFASNKWLIPCTYDGVYLIPNHRYFLVVQGAEKSVCYEAEPDGTVSPNPLPIDGKVCGVDSQGYVTLYRTLEAEITPYPGAEKVKVPFYLHALLDNHYQMVLDYVVGGNSPGRIGFEDGVALIRTGGTGFYSAKFELGWSNSTVGYINRKGEWVGRHDYDNPYCYVSDFSGSNERTWASRSDGKTYWIVEDGGEVPLSTISPEAIRDQCSDWAKSAIEQAKSRGLVSEKMQGYYTLDSYREELCSLLINLYRKLGKELPPLDSAPTFIDCEREHVRLAAALGIISGNAAGEIHPRSRITRQEAADMLYRFTALFRKLDSTASKRYPDDAAIDSKFKSAVYAMRNIGVMSGVSGGNFSPDSHYSIEQAIIAVNRLYDLLATK